MKKYNILLFKNTDWFGKIITWFTGGQFSHTAIVIDEQNILEVSPLTRKIISLKQKKNKDVIEYKVQGVSTLKKMLYLDQAIKEVINSKWYDVLNALFFAFLKITRLYKFKMFFRMFEDKKGIICSEVVSDYLFNLGLKKSEYKHIPNSLISPSDIPIMFKIYRS